MTETNRESATPDAPQVLAADRLLVAIWVALVVVGLRVALQVYIDREVERLRGELLWEHAVDHVLLATRRAWLLVLPLVLLPRGKNWLLGLCRGVATFLVTVVLLSGWPDGEIQYTPGLWSWKGRLGWAVILVLAALVSVLAHWAIHRRRFYFRSSPLLRFGVTSMVLLLGGAWVKGVTLLVEAKRVSLLREVVGPGDNLLERFQQGNAKPTARVQFGSMTPSRNLTTGGNRPSLLLRDGDSVSFQIRPDTGSQFRFSYGVALSSFRNLPEQEREAEVTFGVEIGGQILFQNTLEATTDQDDQRWHDAAIDLEEFIEQGDVSLKLLLNIHGPASEQLVGGFARPRVASTERVIRRPLEADRLNVLLVVIESLRQDHVGAYGYDGGTTPNIDQLAKESLQYDHAVATSSWTWPSVSSLLTGLYPLAHGVVADDLGFLSDSLTTMPELLLAEGITTACWTANPMIAEHKNFHQGFEVWREFNLRSGKLLTREFQDFATRYNGYQFFAYLHYVEPRAPYLPPERVRRRFQDGRDDRSVNRDLGAYAMALAAGDTGEMPDPESLKQLKHLYDAEIATADEEFRRIRQALVDLEIWDKTIVIVTSDHGEEFLDHQGLTHGYRLYRELTRVPLLIRIPGKENKRIAKPVDLSALPATILELMCCDHQNPHWTPPLPPFGARENPLAFSHLQRFHPNGNDIIEFWSIEDGQVKIIQAADGSMEVYDQRQDPFEQRDLAQNPGSREPLIRSLQQELEHWQERCAEIAVESPPDFPDARTRQALSVPSGEDSTKE